MHKLASFTLALGLAACNLAPAYERPKSPVGALADDGGSELSAADRSWRDVFGDPRLQKLIELALANNRDLRIAALNVEVVRASYRIERSALVPQLSATGTGSLMGNEDGIIPTPPSFPQYRVGIGASWEIDLFGRIRNLRDAALEEYLAADQTRRAAHLSLVAQVVGQYLRERAFAEQLAIAERTVALVEEGVALTRRLLEAGQRSDLDAKTAEAQLHAAKAELARLQRQRAQAENLLALLIGQAVPQDLPAARPLDDATVVADLPAGVSSEVLLRRPDVLAAEHSLKAAYANIGAARAAFFPSISLTGFAGFASNALTSLFTGGFAWSLSPSISVPLFNYGRNRATLDVAKLRQQIEVATYERAIQIAFREVADALVAKSTLDEQLAAQTARAEAEQARFALSELRYKSGIENYLVVLAAQQDLYSTQVQLIELRLARLTNLADLYVALGGGWRG